MPLFYQPGITHSGLLFNPFKSCCVPRPIGWLSTVSATGQHNLAPFSQFQNVCYDPPRVMVAANNRQDGSLKDTVRNILETGEFVWSMATYELRREMLRSSADDAPGADEFEKYQIETAPSVLVAPRRVARSPVHMECRLLEKMVLPGNTPEAETYLLVADVIGIHIADAALTDGRIDIARLQPLARLGYRDYTRVSEVFELDADALSGRDASTIAHLSEPIYARAARQE